MLSAYRRACRERKQCDPTPLDPSWSFHPDVPKNDHDVDIADEELVNRVDDVGVSEKKLAAS